MNDKKDIIKKVADEIFRENGFKKTNISEIMKKAKMATGTFYNYYQSKDEVFMEIYLEENEKLKRKIMNEVDLKGHPMEVMGQMMQLNEIGMKENPILCEWYNYENFKKIEQAFHEKKGFETLDFMDSTFIEIVRNWQKNGVMVDTIDAEMIMAIFNAIIEVEAHKDRIGIKYFPDLIYHLSGFVMKGLLK
ncbi:MAG: TetR/AcrR family transcriptional regulator [Clostridiales bacterium]